MNPGYCFLTFSSPAHAHDELTQISTTAAMPNSTQRFKLRWAASKPAANGPALPRGSVPDSRSAFRKEYSVYVGDLAPEASDDDLVAVFRNPVLGLRNDRQPKLIRPFLSCNSAKVIIDYATGRSKGYGFVRFTEEADQSRALIEMHGLYCLSRPSVYCLLLLILPPDLISIQCVSRLPRPSSSLSHRTTSRKCKYPLISLPRVLAWVQSRALRSPLSVRQVTAPRMHPSPAFPISTWQVSLRLFLPSSHNSQPAPVHTTSLRTTNLTRCPMCPVKPLGMA